MRWVADSVSSGLCRRMPSVSNQIIIECLQQNERTSWEEEKAARKSRNSTYISNGVLCRAVWSLLMVTCAGHVPSIPGNIIGCFYSACTQVQGGSCHHTTLIHKRSIFGYATILSHISRISGLPERTACYLRKHWCSRGERNHTHRFLIRVVRIHQPWRWFSNFFRQTGQPCFSNTVGCTEDFI